MIITRRAGRIEDSHSVFQVFVKAIMDYSTRMGVMAITGRSDPEVLESLWKRRKSMLKFLAQTAAQFWVAEQDGEIIAYARSLDIHLQDINRIDRKIVNHRRESIHKWIATTRDGVVYKRNREIVGYGYVGWTFCGRGQQ